MWDPVSCRFLYGVGFFFNTLSVIVSQGGVRRDQRMKVGMEKGLLESICKRLLSVCHEISNWKWVLKDLGRCIWTGSGPHAFCSGQRIPTRLWSPSESFGSYGWGLWAFSGVSLQPFLLFWLRSTSAEHCGRHNLSTRETQVRGLLGSHGQPGLYSEFKASLAYSVRQTNRKCIELFKSIF